LNPCTLRPAARWSRWLVALVILSVPLPARGQGADSTAAAPPQLRPGLVSDAGPKSLPSAQDIADIGFENVSTDTLGGLPRVGFENRRFRHTADALGEIQREIPGRFIGVERRLGLTAASITVDRNAAHPFRVRYPSDPDFVPGPRGRQLDPTSHSVDLLFRPLLSYELGRIIKPVQVRWQLEPLVRYNPWPGARANASVVIPIYTDFNFDPLHPDVDNFRPGMLSLDQFAWIRKVALVSGSAGLFGDNRYGGSIGAARPILDGNVVADAQVDLTGFVAFEDNGLTYSSMSNWSSYLGATWYFPVMDIAIRARYAEFLYGDRGVYGEFKRSFGDFDYSLFLIHSASRTFEGVRVSLPIPPMTRPTKWPVRTLPVATFPISYRTDADPIGISVAGVASREEFLQQTAPPSLEANRFRFDRRLGVEPPEKPQRPLDWVNNSGVSGFTNTPWANTLTDRTVSVDLTQMPKKWAYDHRGIAVNNNYSLSIGLLPRVEANIRFTRIPGVVGFVLDPDNVITTDTDHMASGRLALLTPKGWRPGVAIGAEDLNGTRRFHDSYVVAGLEKQIKDVQTRFSLGYATHVFRAPRYVLDRGFGAVEVSPWRVVAAQAEYDSEKWNVGIGLALPYGLRFRAAALNLETLSVGAGWTHGL